MAKLKEDKENLHVMKFTCYQLYIMNKEGTLVYNRFCRMFICNFRESTTLRRLTESNVK